jgi:DNA-binding transcriptional MerR regulator
MSKSAEAFRTISEVADVLDTPAHVLRFWESRFSQIKPIKRAGGRRYYRPADVALLGGIKRLLHDDGLTIRGVQKMLREQGVRQIAAFGGLDYDADDQEPWAPPSRANAQPTAAPVEMPVTDLLSPALTDATPKPRADRAPGTLARADLQREREASQELTNPVGRGNHGTEDPVEATLLPAAAMLRAMTAYHVAQRRAELTAIHARLKAAHARRTAAGHRSRP